MSPSSEIYYAEMEAARETAEQAYFEARPQIVSSSSRVCFRAGFERAFRLMWTRAQAVEETKVQP